MVSIAAVDNIEVAAAREQEFAVSCAVMVVGILSLLPMAKAIVVGDLMLCFCQFGLRSAAFTPPW